MTTGEGQGSMSHEVRHRFRVFGRLLWAALLTAASLVVAVVMGKVAAHVLWKADLMEVGVWYRIGSLGIGVTFVVSAVRHILSSVERVLAWIHAETREPLYPRVVVLAGMVAVISCCYMLALEAPPPPSTGVELVYLQPGVERSDEPVPTFPVHFSLAKGPTDGWIEGVTLGDGQRQQIQKLTRALLACAGDDPGQEVEVSFRGFADDNEFRRNGEPDRNSDSLNHRTANLRAANLYGEMKAARDALEPGGGANRLILNQPEPWPSLQAMKDGRRFKGLPLTKHEGDQGYLNRRAEVLLKRLGTCDLREREEQTAEPSRQTTLAQRR